MKLFVPLIATAAIAVCIGTKGIAWSQTTEDSSSTTTTTIPMAPAFVTEKTTTVTVPAATSQTTTSSSAQIPSPHPLRGYRSSGDESNMHQQQTTPNP
jgi:hypothetical protein